MTRKFVGWVARSNTQRTHQHLRDVGFPSSTQPTLRLLLLASKDAIYRLDAIVELGTIEVTDLKDSEE
jgi:hypothetical protein